MPRLFTLGTLATALSLPLSAAAQDNPTVAIVGLHQADLSVADQREASEVFVDAVRQAGFFTPRSPMWVQDRLDGREPLVLRDAFGGQGRALLEEGRTLYAQAQMDESVAVLEEAVTELGENMSLSRSPRDLWDALVYLGVARQAAGDYRGGRDAFEDAIALMPLRAPSAQEFPPDLIQRYEDLRRERRALATDVEVLAGDDGTVVWLNGERKGTTPLVIEGVIPGTNYFFGESPLGFTALASQDLPEARRSTVQLRLDTPQLVDPDRSDIGRSRQVASLYSALGEALEADLVLVAGTMEGQASAQLYSRRTDTWTEPVTTRYVGSSADELADVLPSLWVKVRRDGTFEEDAREALPRGLDVSGNVLLSRMLLLPEQDLFADLREDDKPKKLGKVLIITGVTAAVIGGLAWGTAFALTEPYQGRVGVTVP